MCFAKNITPYTFCVYKKKKHVLKIYIEFETLTALPKDVFGTASHGYFPSHAEKEMTMPVFARYSLATLAEILNKGRRGSRLAG